MSDQEIRHQDLKRLLHDAGHQHMLRVQNGLENEKLVARGNLTFKEVNRQIGVHVCDMVESCSTSSCVELAPSLNIIILLAGRVNFSVGANRYDVTVNKYPRAFANVVNHKDVFSRHMQKGQHVKKLTLSISREWLAARCQSEQDPFISLLCGDNRVIDIPLTQHLIEQVNELFQLQKQQGHLVQKLRSEVLTISILEQCIPSLQACAHNPFEKVTEDTCEIKQSLRLREQVEELARHHHSLKDIANALNISPSTLQRKFKSSFQITVQEHILTTRLEKARKSLLVDGLSIGEVAYSAGYKHVANFVTAFKKKFDMTPSELRRKHLN